MDGTMIKTEQPVNLVEVFGVIRSHRMRLNPKNYVFGISSGKFLGYLIYARGIEANLDKI